MNIAYFQYLPRAMRVEVTWRPPQTLLHYNELYLGIFEYLRAPPNDDFREDALDYLGSIIENNGVSYHPSVRRMQFHRIMWIHEWLKVLHERDELSESDTVLDLPD